jgi:hypothetical protein
MGPYDQRNVTLDPGLTALALRGLHERDGHYPFIERFRRRRQPRRRAPRSVAARESRRHHAVPAEPAPESTSLWSVLFGRRRLVTSRPSSSAA